MSALSIEVAGVPDVVRNVADFAQRFERRLEAAAYEEAEDIIRESKTQEVPGEIFPGILRETGHAKPPVRQGDLIVVELGFGGPAAPHAAEQHERDYRHLVGKRKYLEDPVLRRARVLADNIAARARRQSGVA